MLPKPPPREGSLGFLYLPPYRVQGVSIAGECTAIQIPELDINFDMGVCPRAMLASPFTAISHGHMDHIGAIAYWCSQRHFQGMGTGTIVCDERLEKPLRALMAGYVDVEQQRTPFEIVALAPEGEIEIKNTVFLRAFKTEHTAPSVGYVLVEKRSKLKPELVGLPQEKLCELKDRGETITRIIEVPLVAYLGDTSPGPHLLRQDVLHAQVVICECTFTEPEHVERARVGMHMHAQDIAEWLGVLQTPALVLTHLSRRTSLPIARNQLSELIKEDDRARVHILMDHRANRARYDAQQAEAELAEAGSARS